MPNNFASINEAQGGAVPQFQQVPTVSGDTGEGVLSAANLATSLFQQATQFQVGKAAAQAQTSVGLLQDKLTRIRQAGSTDSSVDVVSQQRIALTEFNAQHPQLAGDATKAFKTATGTSPGGLSVEERAELDSRNEAINSGWGRFGASDEYNQEQYEAYITLKEQDRLLTSQTKRDAAAIQARTLHKSVQKDRILAGANQMFQTYTGKTESDMKDLRERWAAGTVGTEQAMMEIREARITINKEITSLGEFGTDPVINIYSQPTLDSLQLAEDVITGKIEVDAVNAITTRNTTMAKAKFLADPKMLALYTATEMFPNVTGTDSQITSKVLNALNGGIIKQSDLRTGEGSPKAKPVDVSDMDDGEQSVFMQTMENMFQGGVTGNTDRTIAQAANTMAGVIKHFQRNYEDLDPEDSRFIVKALAIPGAMESLSKEQQVIAMDAMNTHIITVVDVAVRENITQSTLTAISPREAPSVRQLAQTGTTRPTSEVADLIVEGGITAWKVKPEFLSQPRVRAQVQQINKNIREDITPSVDVMALGLQISPEQYQSTLFAIDEVGKPQAGGEVSVNASFSRKERREGGKKEEVSKPEPAPVSVEPAPEAPTEPVVSDRLIKHMEKREGRREKSYLDSLGKPTGGIGHLLSKEEQALYPEGTAIPKEVVDAWFTEDIAEAQAAAAEQGAQVPGSTPEFEEALVSMNFQLGTGWTSKFPTAWANMKAGDFIGAAHELEFTSEGSGVQSDWMKQTPVRVKDAKAALVLMQRGTFKK